MSTHSRRLHNVYVMNCNFKCFVTSSLLQKHIICSHFFSWMCKKFQSWQFDRCRCKNIILQVNSQRAIGWKLGISLLGVQRPDTGPGKCIWPLSWSPLFAKWDLWMFFKKPKELFLETTDRNYKKASVREFRLCWMINFVRIVQILFCCLTLYVHVYLRLFQ